MIADAIKDVSKRNGIVLDPFGGSGSPLIAANKTGRRGCLAELDSIYVDCIIRRWQAYAKDDAVLLSSGVTLVAIPRSRAMGHDGLIMQTFVLMRRCCAPAVP
jgi:DNA modification methylase